MQFGSRLSIAFGEVGSLSFSGLLTRFGPRALRDGQSEKALQLSPKGRERDGYVVRFSRFRYCVGFSLSRSPS